MIKSKLIPFTKILRSKSAQAVCLSWLVLTPVATAQDIIPLPREIQKASGEFKFRPDISFSAHGGCEKEVQFFAAELRKSTGWPLEVKNEGAIRFIKDPAHKHGYELKIDKRAITVRAANTANLFYGFQTLRQLGPPALFSQTIRTELKDGWNIPCLHISDSPRFSWRGILTDVSREFQTKEEMLKLIDSMAMVKLNVLHWHLTDDQGWRPEIKAYPKLTAGTDKKYTQEDLKEIVSYAAQRGITIVPEIDVPGHSAAVARAYPELCLAKENGKGRHNLYDVSNPDVYVFLDAVFKELSAIFPGEYVHLGADEAHHWNWEKNARCRELMKKHEIKNSGELQAFFVKKVQGIIAKHGRKAIAWDEAFSRAGDTDLAIMSWRGVQPGIKAARKGHKVVLCPVSALYYDRAQSRSKKHPNGYSRNTVVMSQSYFFEPAVPTLDAKAKANIMGAQGCIWGEQVNGGDHLQRLAMLRGAALAESLWSPRAKLDWESFLKRLATHRKRLDARGIPYWWEPETTPVKVGAWSSVSESGTQETDVTSHISKAGLHEFLFHYKQGEGSFNILKAELLQDGKVVATDTHAYTGTVEPRGVNQFYLLKLPQYKPKAKYTLRYRIDVVKGGCSGVVMHIPPLEKSHYSEQRGPETKTNVSGQKQPDEL